MALMDLRDIVIVENSSAKPWRIALVGKIHVDKTFVAEHLRVYHGFERRSMSDPLKIFIKQVYYFHDYKRVPWERRQAMYDALYKIDKEMWVKSMQERVKRAIKPTVIDDVRYLSELKALKEMDFKVIRVLSPKRKRVAMNTIGKHSAAGTLYLHELYNKDFTQEIEADYNIHHKDRDSTRQQVDLIMADIDKQQ
jgi:hypothetical protein